MIWLHGFLSDLISSVHPTALTLPHRQLSSFGGGSSLMIGFQFNVPPLTDLLASVTSKSCWPPPCAVPLVTHDLSLFSERSSMAGGQHPAHPLPSSISTTAVPVIQRMLAQHLLNKPIKHTSLPWDASASQRLNYPNYKSRVKKTPLSGTYLRVVFTSRPSRPGELINHLESMATASIRPLHWLVYIDICMLSFLHQAHILTITFFLFYSPTILNCFK